MDARDETPNPEANRRWEKHGFTSVESASDLRQALAIESEDDGLIVHGYDDLSRPYFQSKPVVAQIPTMGDPGRLQVKVYSGSIMLAAVAADMLIGASLGIQVPPQEHPASRRSQSAVARRAGRSRRSRPRDADRLTPSTAAVPRGGRIVGRASFDKLRMSWGVRMRVGVRRVDLIMTCPNRPKSPHPELVEGRGVTHPQAMEAFVYMLRCADGAYYVGSHRGSDVAHRVADHNNGLYPKAWTFKRRPVELVWSEQFASVLDAIAYEWRLKGWSRAKKEALIRGDWAAVQALARGGAHPPSTSSG